MRTKNLFRTLVAATLAVVSTSAFAQYRADLGATTGGAYDASLVTSDYATIGSRMPYFVLPDANILTLVGLGSMNQSQFKWVVNNSVPAPVATPILNVDGSGATAGDGTVNTNYYVANEISILWDDALVDAGSIYTVNATEHSVVDEAAPAGFDNGCESGTTTTRNIYVLDRPTLSYQAAFNRAVCATDPATSPTFYVPIHTTGMGTFNVTYSVDLNGTIVVASDEVTGFGASEADADGTIFARASAERNLNGTWDNGHGTGVAGLPITLSSAWNNGGYGKYTVNVTKISDIISRKSLVTINSDPLDIPATDYYFYVVPTPTTNAIQHRSNTAW